MSSFSLLVLVIACFGLIHGEDADQRIIGGKSAEQAQFPYQVSIQYRSTRFSTNKFCAGSIIDLQHILTAAHCVKMDPTDGKELYVVAGVSDAFDLANNNAQIALVEKSYVHPEYTQETLEDLPYNDIAILKLAKPLTQGRFVRKIDLAAEDYQPAGTGQITGWGATSYPPKDINQSQNLLYADVDVTPFEECAKIYHGLSEVNHLCAKGNGSNACQGDSGGPFLQKISGKPTLVGVINWGDKCEEPTVMAKVSSYRKFIQEVLDKKNVAE